MKGYGQFCPVAKASEILAERWTPLVLRELLCGSHRFNDLRRGLPLMSRSLLSKRLRELEAAGLVERRALPADRSTHAYFLTPAGEELRPVIEGLGAWGQRWIVADLDEDDLDPSLLMWDVRRNLANGDLPERRIVLQVEFPDVAGRQSRWWLLLDAGEADLCLTDPGFRPDLVLRIGLADLTRWWLGRTSWRTLVRRDAVRIEGPRHLRGTLPELLGRSPFASAATEDA
jgi:DNA-binding HxlR family transcriptional regulator